MASTASGPFQSTDPQGARHTPGRGSADMPRRSIGDSESSAAPLEPARHFRLVDQQAGVRHRTPTEVGCGTVLSVAPLTRLAAHRARKPDTRDTGGRVW